MMALGDASGIERCFISMIPPKCKVLKHRDANVVDDGCVRFHCSINSAPGIVFYCGETDQEEVMTPDNGDIYYFRNDLPHWIENNSDQVRYSLYADLKCDWSKQYKGGDDDNE
jgi:aspartyl/asparaginyl beta-hydroxylase (cupin superfamily)